MSRSFKQKFHQKTSIEFSINYNVVFGILNENFFFLPSILYKKTSMRIVHQKLKRIVNHKEKVKY